MRGSNQHKHIPNANQIVTCDLYLSSIFDSKNPIKFKTKWMMKLMPIGIK